jgi:hypothetical protein
MIKRLLQFLFLLTWCIGAYSQASGLVDLKFGRYQIADSQWNVSACTQTATCQIYSKNPGTAYKIPWWSGQIQWATGDYIGFIDNAHKDANNPWLAVQYGSNGVAKTNMGTGHIVNMGSDYFFFVGNDNDTGQLFSMTQGFANTSGVSWTGTLNPTQAQVNQYATNGSTTPLAAGQTAQPAPPPPPQYPSYVTIGGGTAATMTFTETSTLSATQQSKVTTWANRTAPDGNIIYINQIGGDNNTVTMDQDGNKNLIRLQLNGTNNAITARQGVQGIGQNEMKLNFEGNNNVVNLNQARNTQGNPVGGNGHYLDATIAGWGTSLTVQQTNTGGVGGHYNETTINGNGNNVTARQTDNGNKIMFLKVDGALNTIDAVQKGTGQHKLDVTLTGNNNSVQAVQEGTIANNATLNLTNAGGPASVILQQNGGQSVGVTTSCATAGGCAPITVRQGY